MSLSVGVNSWISRTDADAYFADRLKAAAWTGAGTADKDAALVTAWRYLTAHPHYALGFPGDQAMKDAQCEQAIFLLQNQDELDERMALQAQGMQIVQLIGGFIENYGGGVILPLAHLAKARLEAHRSGKAIGSAELERDDDKGAEL